MNHVSLHGQLQADPQRTSSAIFFTLIVTRRQHRPVLPG